MTAPFFYGDAAELGALTSGDVYVLDGEEGRHAVTVKRLSVGEPVLIGDGAGAVAAGVVERTVGKAELVVAVQDVVRHSPPNPVITVVQALIKGDRMERAIETMTEAGADRIVLWQSKRSIVRTDAASAQKLRAKLATRAQQAAKQARRAYVPEVTDIVKTADLAAELGRGLRILVLHEDATTSLADALGPVASGEDEGQGIVIVVGPEGGIGADECALLAEFGGTAVALGPSVMRASTAGTVALGWVMGASGRWTVRD